MRGWRDKLVNGEAFEQEKFTKPSKEFGILPFWFVNGEMDYCEMERQIREFADKGMPGFIFHSRFGIKDYMPYMGQEWMDRYNFAAKKAKELGMQVWIYDEYNWPSGTCNQEIMAEEPELTSRYLQLVVNRIPGQYFMYMEGTDSRYNDLEQSEPVFACAILDENLQNGKNEILNLMPNICFDKVISWQAPQGPWHLCYFIERKASWYSDVLNEDATKAFIRKVHENYKQHIDGPIADSVGGFYTDEPAMHYFTAGADNMIIPWSAKMFKIFKDWNGYDLKPRLPQLFYEIGDDYHKVRHDFWSCLSKQYEKAYFKQIREWCEENEVLFTGHLLHEEYLRCHAKSGGNLFHLLKNMHMTGVDHLYPRIGTREMPEEHVALKIASSAAHQNGSTRLICESLGGSYWDCTMERMKWIADWEYVLGVNILNPHGFHYSIEGERKRDWPPSQFYHHTWWRHYGLFNDYIKRLGYVMTGGYHGARVAVLYPINSLWADFVPQKADRCSKLCQDDFEYMTDALLRLHYDFDYIDEDMMRKMTLENGKISIEGETWDLVILPPMTHIKENTLRLLKTFYEGGGKLIADTLLPCGLLEPDNSVGIEAVEAIFGVDGETLRDAYLAGNEDAECHITKHKHAPEGEALVIHGPGLRKAEGINILGEAIASLTDWDIAIDNEDLFHLFRIKDGVPFYFIINPENRPITAEISFRQKGSPQYYNLIDGHITDVPVYTRDGDIVTLSWEFPAVGSAVFSFTAEEKPHVQEADFTVTQITHSTIEGHTKAAAASAVWVSGGQKLRLETGLGEPADDICFAEDWVFKTSIDNALLIKNWMFALADETNRDFYREDFDTSGWLTYTIGGWELQLPYERENNDYPVDVLYKAEFTADYIPEDMKILIDGFKGTSYDLYINGNLIQDKGERSFLDAEIRQVYIAGYAKTGRNDIALRMTVEKKVQGLLDFIKITGSLALKKQGETYTIVRPCDRIRTGSWTEQGYPYYSGTGTLTQTVYIPAEALSGKLTLQVDCGKDVLEASVNGQNAGCCLWAPYALDITGLVKEGNNEIAVCVTNTLNNLLEGVEQPSGVFNAAIVCENTVTLPLSV